MKLSDTLLGAAVAGFKPQKLQQNHGILEVCAMHRIFFALLTSKSLVYLYIHIYIYVYVCRFGEIVCSKSYICRFSYTFGKGRRKKKLRYAFLT